VYGGLVVFALIAGLLFIAVPHYKPLKLASTQEIQDAHHDIIKQYFVDATTCKHDNRGKTDRVKTFNKYFGVNQYNNRAVFRGCQDTDVFLTKTDAGKWVKTGVKLDLSKGLSTELQKACMVGDITKTHGTSNSADANNRKICDSLSKQSYIQQWFE
jgi:hypothetical protein